MPNPTVGLSAACFTTSSHALTVSDCARLFSSSNCTGFSVSNNMCKCTGCPNNGPISDNIMTAPDGIYLNGSCASGGDTTITCRKCNKVTNPCYTAQWVIDGQIFCLYQRPQGGCNTDTNVISSVMASQCCENGYGIEAQNATRCIVASCASPFAPDSYYMSCNSCGGGYYKDPNTTSWVITAEDCLKCPSYPNANIQTMHPGDSITNCYIPTTAILTDDIGKFRYSDNCHYGQ